MIAAKCWAISICGIWRQNSLYWQIGFPVERNVLLRLCNGCTNMRLQRIWLPYFCFVLCRAWHAKKWHECYGWFGINASTQYRQQHQIDRPSFSAVVRLCTGLSVSTEKMVNQTLCCCVDFPPNCNRLWWSMQYRHSSVLTALGDFSLDYELSCPFGQIDLILQVSKINSMCDLQI